MAWRVLLLGVGLAALVVPRLASAQATYQTPGGGVLTVQHVGASGAAPLPGVYFDRPSPGNVVVSFHPHLEGRLDLTYQGPGTLSVGGIAENQWQAPVTSLSNALAAGQDVSFAVREGGSLVLGEVRELSPGDPRYTGTASGGGGGGGGAGGGAGGAGGGGATGSQRRTLVPCGVGDAPPCTLQELVKLGVNIFNYLLALGGVVALLAVIVAGIRYILAVFQEGDIDAAKAALRNAIIGLVVLLLAVVIVRTVTTQLGLKRETLPSEAGDIGDLVQ